MDFSEDEDHVAIAEAIRGLCAEFDDDYWSRCDDEHRFPWEFYGAMAEGGWVGIAHARAVRRRRPRHHRGRDHPARRSPRAARR